MSDTEHRALTETENKIYLLLSLIFEKIMDNEASYEVGLYQWQKLRPEILTNIGLTDDVWTDISDYGDKNDELQDRLEQLRIQYENYSRDRILSSISEILNSI